MTEENKKTLAYMRAIVEREHTTKVPAEKRYTNENILDDTEYYPLNDIYNRYNNIYIYCQ